MLAGLILLLTSTLPAQTSFDGRFYEQAALLFGKEEPVYTGTTILGLNLDSLPSESVRIRAGIELPYLHQRKPAQPGLQLRTLNAAFTIGPSKLTIGRFLPSWGVSRVFRPMDLFRTQSFIQNSLSFTGVDGVFWKIYAGSLAIGLIGLPEPDITQTRGAAFTEFRLGSCEFLFAGLYDPKEAETTAGLTLKGDLFLGLNAEILFRNGTAAWDGDRTAWKASLGADWSFAKHFFVSAGYFFDETGVFQRDEYPMIRVSESSRMTLGRHYAESDFNILTWDETRIGISGLMNITDRSFILWPYASREFFSNFFLGLSWYWFGGENETEFAPTDGRKHLLNASCYARF